MKRLLAVLLMLLVAVPAMAILPVGDSVCVLTQTGAEPSARHMWRQYTCTADSGDGSMLPYTITGFHDFYLYSVETWPGGTAPTDNSDFTLTDPVTGEDLMGGNGTNGIDATTAKTLLPRSAAMILNFDHMVKGNLTLTIIHNYVLSAIMNIRVAGVYGKR
jgi:hypothetical protein